METLSEKAKLLNDFCEELKEIYNFIGEGIESPERSQRKLKDVWLKIETLKNKYLKVEK